MRALSHPSQEDRLRALRSYEVLDTDREQDFDDIVKLAAEICGTAISVVNLIDAERQWFKAEIGLGVRETPIETSICSHVILEPDFVEIPDTLEDNRMRDNPLCVGEPGLRFYAGALLKTEEGLPLGTLCVLDYQPRELTPLQRDTLRVLARQVMAQLELRKGLKNAEVLRKEADHRVKNSLQSLSSFARLQRRSFSSPDARRALSHMMTRIDAMSSLHEQLYKLDEHAEVTLDVYVRQVGDQLAAFAPAGISLEISASPVIVDAQQAVAVGTFLNEFVTNSFKHAFPGGRGGRVRVRLEPQGGGMVRLACSDDGVGLPDDPQKDQAGLGMKIAEVVCAELSCDFDLQSGPNGVTASLIFEPRYPVAHVSERRGEV
ncbi:Two-component sensor histidine kinase, contains HisKA and HATPase domains [Palleronia marisminoris]|uniref:Putative sensor histidine kinase pdtaS n=1 Tax=Palleronia marisminoris TaxID=315423 RepID=A0A1Y5TE86_9RHOB|nr:histidine kinase dimerization/phosphoacceptor domain -containing protein [Palleronia marisminoris]SFH36808.1 Two-component sensor histidine kinase, contains HisKA and HATPase domains [Palleronia marisminoris]SLN62278.1 putative sensor histidine kinase pdtaS [Palleronia marisminoris]